MSFDWNQGSCKDTPTLGSRMLYDSHLLALHLNTTTYHVAITMYVILQCMKS